MLSCGCAVLSCYECVLLFVVLDIIGCFVGGRCFCTAADGNSLLLSCKAAVNISKRCSADVDVDL